MLRIEKGKARDTGLTDQVNDNYFVTAVTIASSGGCMAFGGDHISKGSYGYLNCSCSAFTILKNEYKIQ